MKIMTLNTHSIIEPKYDEKLIQFVAMIEKEQPEIFGLQEVNQTLGKLVVKNLAETGYVRCKGERIAVLEDNHALTVAKMLQKKGIHYEWTWIPLKIGYKKYEEGLAVFSKAPIEETHQFFISNCRIMSNWKTRKMLGIKVAGNWFYSAHMGWWDDEEEPFINQWDRVLKKLGNPEDMKTTCFIMGDFNAPSEIRGEGYDYVRTSGWKDTWQLASEKDNGITVGKAIDGWRERVSEETRGMRIDYIWCNREIDVVRSEVVFNGRNYPIVSDHYGVQIEVNL